MSELSGPVRDQAGEGDLSLSAHTLEAERDPLATADA